MCRSLPTITIGRRTILIIDHGPYFFEKNSKAFIKSFSLKKDGMIDGILFINFSQEYFILKKIISIRSETIPLFSRPNFDGFVFTHAYV